MKTRLSLSPLVLCAALWAGVVHAQQIQLTPVKATGIYSPGEKIVWDVKVSGENAATVKAAQYRILKGGGTPLSTGTIDLSTGSAQIETAQTEPLAYQAEVSAKVEGAKDIRAYGGAVVSPEKIAPSLPRPADFDAFWAAKMQKLATIPANPVLQSEPSEREGVDYSKITLDNINGTKIRGQIARPTQGEKFPAIIQLQWAGVYGLPKNWVTGYAASGWLAMNISAHDLPLDETPQFYKSVGETILRGYATQGNDNRENSYMLRMILSCVRATQYLASRPDWNGQTLVATGNSQGGYQSIAVAGLMPQITAVTVGVPAGCDMAGMLAGRRTPWPNWTLSNVTDANRDAVIQTSAYFDPVNFASRIQVPVLISVGLIDNTSTPAGVFAMANQIKGPKEIVVLPLAEHQSINNSHAPYERRAAQWRDALVKGQAAPVQAQP